MYDESKELLKSDKEQWSTNSKIEAEGLEWLYTDPNQQKNKEKGLEAYLLGESIPGARGELQKTDELEKTGPPSTLDSTTIAYRHDDTISKFREDPLFIIKKLELKQKQIINKYSSLADSYVKESRRTIPRSSSGRDQHDSDESKRVDRRSHYSRRSYSTSPDYRRRSKRSPSRDYKRDRYRSRSNERYRSIKYSRDEYNRTSRYRSSRYKRSSSPSHSRSRDKHPRKSKTSRSPPTKSTTKGPERPKNDSLSYAFGVTDDILPPQAIIDAGKAKEKEMMNKRRMYKSQSSDEVLLEEMQREGSKHLNEKLSNIAEMERLERLMEERDKNIKGDFVSDFKKQMLQSAKMSEIIKRKAAKQYDPFNEEVV